VVNLVAQKIEVTQGTQDLNNSVRLVRDKRTFVRFHVRSTQGGNQSTFARLRVQRGGSTVWLNPINGMAPGFITVRSAPDRGTLDHAFLFELPSGYREGTVTITAYLNPVTDWRSRNPVETSYADNDISTTVTFETVPTVHLVTYRISYRISGTTYTTAASHVNQMHDWLRRAFPLRTLTTWTRTHDWGSASRNADGDLTNPRCGDVNSFLGGKAAWDILFDWSIPIGTRYYGMVTDAGGFMRGCAPVPGLVASGPTGPGTWGWDCSYGDWYGGYELGHAYGRGHANFCGAEDGPSYPYPNGRISPTLTGDNAIYGFDISTRAIYGPTSGDLMSYCDNQWLSDFTYEALLSTFQTGPVAAAADLRSVDQTERLLVVGTIDPATHAVTLQPLFVVPNAGDIKPRVPGDYGIVLRGADGAELARYPFTPEANDGGPGPDQDRHVDLLAINELVPYVAGTTRVEIVGPPGAVLTGVNAGAHPPQVTVVSPNGGEVLSGNSIVVSWMAGDPDGDPLTFNVQYSPDNGATWEMVAQNLTGTSATLDATNFVAGNQARVRVWASDGIHSASDESDATFVIPNRVPTVTIIRPANGTTIFVEQSLNLEADAYDVDAGSLDGAQVQWTSNLDGVLGDGAQLTVSTLRAGTHQITVRADDGQGGVATASVTVTVRDDLAESFPPVFLPWVLK
jgi:hypothetical protein